MAPAGDALVPAKGTGPGWPEWLEQLYTLADDLDAAGFARAVGENGTMVFGNGPLLTGIPEVEGAVADLFSAITSMRHRPLKVWQSETDTIFEAIVEYGRPDGRVVEIPAVTAYTRDVDGTLHGRIYCDLAPIFAPE